MTEERDAKRLCLNLSISKDFCFAISELRDDTERRRADMEKLRVEQREVEEKMKTLTAQLLRLRGQIALLEYEVNMRTQLESFSKQDNVISDEDKSSLATDALTSFCNKADIIREL